MIFGWSGATGDKASGCEAFLNGSSTFDGIQKNIKKEGKAMKVMRLNDLKEYQAAKHFKMSAMRLQGKEETGIQKFWVGLSHFLPGGGAEFDASPTEKVYIVLSGQVTVKTEKEEQTLNPLDSVYLAPNEGRSVINPGKVPASMLVIINYPS
jgi:quercetin dioxygenase-like cupin family protein